MTMAQVAFAVGYNHQANLTSAFYRVHGISPTKWGTEQRVPQFET